MSKITTIIKICSSDINGLWLPLFKKLSKKGLLNWISDKIYIKIFYLLVFRKKLKLRNPSTFNEKIQWLKLNDRNPLYSILVDKYEVKNYVSSIIGEEYIIPTIGIWDSPNDIVWENLPNKFVLKTTDGSGGNDIIICNNVNELNKDKSLERLKNCMNGHSFRFGREWPYKRIKSRIIAESLIEDTSGTLKDYKFFCFNSKVRCFKIDFDRYTEHHANYYDKNGNLLEFGEVLCPPVKNANLEVPENINKMICLAEKLSQNIPFVRIDFYNVQGKIYFGEITFYPASGFGKFTPDNWDEILGSWLKLQ